MHADPGSVHGSPSDSTKGRRQRRAKFGIETALAQRHEKFALRDHLGPRTGYTVTFRQALMDSPGLRGDDMRRDSLHDDVNLGGVSVLVVDDYEPLRVGVVAMLESYGAAVTAVGSADEAFEALQREHPDVLLSDLAMPGKSGYWLIGQVRGLPLERGGATPAAALTGFTGPEHRASILRAGFQFHIEKPVAMERLAGVVALLALKA
jgi:CheY-like chemotaxis protein